MQIKTTMRYYFISIGMAIIKINKENTGNNKCWLGCGEIGILVNYWWESKMVQALQKKKKIKGLLYDLAVPLLSMKTRTRTDTYTPMFIAALFTVV